MPKLKRKQIRELVRIGEYLLSGGAYFWSGYAMFFVLDKGFGFNLWWAKLFANITGWTVNYLLQRYWVFNNPRLKTHEQQVTGRYVAITLFNFVLDYFIVAGLRGVGITPYIGQFISAGFFTFWNYLWYKFWVFYRPAKATQPNLHSRGRVTPLYHHHPGLSLKKIKGDAKSE